MVTTESKGAFCAGTSTPPKVGESGSQKYGLAEPVPTMPRETVPDSLPQDSQGDPDWFRSPSIATVPGKPPQVSPPQEVPKAAAPESELGDSASAAPEQPTGRDPNYFKSPDLFEELDPHVLSQMNIFQMYI